MATATELSPTDRVDDLAWDELTEQLDGAARTCSSRRGARS